MFTREILKIEGDIEERFQKTKNIIYLIREGDNSPWYKAYNWSAYLMEFFPNNLSYDNKLKVVKKSVKSENGTIIVFVGLQLPSLEKYLPNVKIKDSSSNIVEIQVNIDDYKECEFDIFDMSNYKDWIESIPLKENKQENKNKTVGTYATNFGSNPNTFIQILQKLLKFSCDNNTTREDLINFINELKQDIIRLFI